MTSESSIPDVGQRLAAARLSRGLAQKEAARRAGIAASYLSRIETGKVQPTIGTTLQIVRALGARSEEIFGSGGKKDSRGPCPLTTQGRCLLDLIGAEKAEGHFTPREIRLIKRFTSWVEGAEATRLRAMEILLEDLTGAGEEPSG